MSPRWRSWPPNTATKGRRPNPCVNRRAIALAEAQPQRNEAELQTLHSNLGIALQQAGDLAGAAAEFGRAADIAERTSGADFYRLAASSKHARTLHLSGDRAQAQVLFSVCWPAWPHSLSIVMPLSVNEDAGERLAAEGRPAEGLVLLRQAEAGYAASSQHDFDLRRVRRHIGDALARLGRHDEALATLGQPSKAFPRPQPARPPTHRRLPRAPGPLAARHGAVGRRTHAATTRRR